MSGIEWTDRTWNPVTGCTKVSPGCDHCYAETIARRFAGSKAFPRGFDVTLHPERLDAPLRWRKPSRVFVNSMSDLFHDNVPDDFIACVWAVMAATPQHTYQVLTKRHGRMRALLSSPAWPDAVDLALRRLMLDGQLGEHACAAAPRLQDQPAPNVWLGVSAEDQARADLRIPALIDTPAAVRFISAEPLLGPVDLHGPADAHGARSRLTYWLTGRPGFAEEGSPVGGSGMTLHALTVGPRLDWVIVGGESGPGARPMAVEWASSLVAQCRGAGVAVFVKQLGSAYGPRKGGDMDTWPPDLRGVREFPAGAR